MSKITEYLEIYTQEYLLNLALENVEDDMDKREGAIIYDTLSIFCGKLADTFMEIKKMVDQSYILTATDDTTIDYRVAERGIERYAATTSKRLGIFTYNDGTPATISVGALFSTIDENKENVINYIVTEQYTIDGVPVSGSYVLECQVEGTIGNTYFGEILPLSDMDTLGSATLTTVLEPARDREENDSVKERYFNTFNMEAFGGNISDYREYMTNFTGVGQTQIYPRTKVDEGIVLSCIDPSNLPISTEYQNTIKQTLDPENYYNNGNDTSGMGLGVVPIGHKVTVTTPQQTTLDFEFTIIRNPNVSASLVTENIERNVANYITQVTNQWDDGDGEYELVVYSNQVLVAASSAEGVTNVNEWLINGDSKDVILTQDRTTQYIPKIGTITIKEVS